MRMLFIFQVIRRHLTKALWRKRSGTEIEEIIYHHDNAPSHRAADTLETIDFLSMERLEHTPYSPDLAPMNFALFPRLKSKLRGKRFEDLDHLECQWAQCLVAMRKPGSGTLLTRGLHDSGNVLTVTASNLNKYDVNVERKTKMTLICRVCALVVVIVLL